MRVTLYVCVCVCVGDMAEGCSVRHLFDLLCSELGQGAGRAEVEGLVSSLKITAPPFSGLVKNSFN